MPIYVYISDPASAGCKVCAEGFELVQKITDLPPSHCPDCGSPVRKKVAKVHAVMNEPGDQRAATEKTIRDYEKAGKWSHAAELADKQSEKMGDKGLKSRAMDNYKKAGYNVDDP